MIKRLFILVLLMGTITIFAQEGSEEDCESVVEDAFLQVMEICNALGRDEACYGNVFVEASPRGNIADFVFETQGDIEDVIKIERLQLRAESVVELGVAVMQIRANIRDDRAENITLLLMGNTIIQNDSDIVVESPLTVTTRTAIYLRPSSTVIGYLEADQTVMATGYYTDESGVNWVRVRFLGDARRNGWMQIDTVPDDLPEVGADSRGFGPMQAFTLTSGSDDRICAEAPDSGILIQTSEGVGEISLLVNEVDIQLGSTAYIHTTDDDRTMIYLLEGRAFVTANGVSQTVLAGMQTEIQQGGTPRFPRAYDYDRLLSLPVYALPRPIRIALPRSPVVATPTFTPAPVTRATSIPTSTSMPTPTPTETMAIPG